MYLYTNTVNGKVYVGQTVRPARRISEHRRCVGVTYFHKAIKKYGFDKFDYNILCEAEDADIQRVREFLNMLEKHYVSFYNSNDPKKGYNMTEGGDGVRMRGHIPWNKGKHTGPLSEEHIKKMSGENNHNFGKSPSVETRRKLSEKNKGKKMSPEARQKMSAAKKGKPSNNKGKSFSEEFKKKLSEAHSSYKKKVHCIDLGLTFESVHEASKRLNLTASGIGNCCRKKAKTCKGHQFEYVA